MPRCSEDFQSLKTIKYNHHQGIIVPQCNFSNEISFKIDV
jgi:hypothetical protein